MDAVDTVVALWTIIAVICFVGYKTEMRKFNSRVIRKERDEQ